MRNTLLRRFLRMPFPDGRFEIGVVGSQDGSMFPYFMPGTLMLVDRQCGIAVGPGADHANNTYWCIHNEEHRCYVPVERDGTILLNAPASPGVYLACENVTLVGEPRTAFWQVAEERSKDFFTADFRDRDTQNYVHALRAGDSTNLPGVVLSFHIEGRNYPLCISSNNVLRDGINFQRKRGRRSQSR